MIDRFIHPSETLHARNGPLKKRRKSGSEHPTRNRSVGPTRFQCQSSCEVGTDRGEVGGEGEISSEIIITTSTTWEET